MVRGETKKFTITVTDKDSGDVIDCTVCTGILLGLYQDGGKLLQKWSKVGKTGFDVIDVTNADAGVLVVYVKVNNLQAGIRDKMLKFEGKFDFPDAAFPSSKMICIDTNILVEELETSIFEGVDAS